MKTGKPHDVPLSDRAIEILAEARRRARKEPEPDSFVFFGMRPKKPVSPMAMMQLLRRKKVNTTVHGFRSAARSWMADQGVAFELAEACLAHQVGNAVVQAYQRSSMLESRRRSWRLGRSSSPARRRQCCADQAWRGVIRIAISRARRPSRAIMATLSGLALLVTAVPVSAKQASAASSAAVPAPSAAFSGYIGEVHAVIRSRLFYPRAARARGAKGVVGVSFTIGPSGAVSAFAITRSSGDKDLDAAARALVHCGPFSAAPGRMGPHHNQLRLCPVKVAPSEAS